MLSLDAQIERGVLVCPETGERLVKRKSALTTTDGRRSYLIRKGIPFLLSHESPFGNRPTTSVGPAHEVEPRQPSRLHSVVDRLLGFVGDQRSKASTDAWARFVERLSDDDLCLAVGGGPRRFHPALVNLNVEALDNVDLVADAHRLPYADCSVEAIQCEAVLEHLCDPFQAVREMFRVLRPGGEVYCVTPFLQGFHGYPSHFFNPTLEGHRHLFRMFDFELLESGVCVGPSWMISSLLVEYVGHLVPVRGLRAMAMTAARVILLPVPLIDRLLNRSPRAHILASTTFVRVRKPTFVA